MPNALINDWRLRAANDGLEALAGVSGASGAGVMAGCSA